MYCTSSPENPVMLMAIKPEVISQKKLSIDDQQGLLQDIVDEVSCSSNPLFISRTKHREDSGKWCSHNSIKKPANKL